MSYFRSIWQDLGIEPTDDVRAIKKAYAKKSREYHPEEFPEEFARLKASYEKAIEIAKSGQKPSHLYYESADELEEQETSETEDEEELDYEEQIKAEQHWIVNQFKEEEKQKAEEKPEVGEQPRTENQSKAEEQQGTEEQPKAEEKSRTEEKPKRDIYYALRVQQRLDKFQENNTLEFEGEDEALVFKTETEADYKGISDYQRLMASRTMEMARGLARMHEYKDNPAYWKYLFKRQNDEYRRNRFVHQDKFSQRLFPDVKVTAFILDQIFELPILTSDVYDAIASIIFPKKMDEEWKEVYSRFCVKRPDTSNRINPVRPVKKANQKGYQFIRAGAKPSGMTTGDRATKNASRIAWIVIVVIAVTISTVIRMRAFHDDVSTKTNRQEVIQNAIELSNQELLDDIDPQIVKEDDAYAAKVAKERGYYIISSYGFFIGEQEYYAAIVKEDNLYHIVSVDDYLDGKVTYEEGPNQEEFFANYPEEEATSQELEAAKQEMEAERQKFLSENNIAIDSEE
ncbi:hypothetical protein SAMN02910298_01430 [Pseudobutyrivibrio sp. YE44]|uniref:J domain-containing protein n=1 Tax=Pseudobutyrivibrio sp. YE44 TaxID=1520802 RepID=UPI0008893A93|nr:J domain-containing protein [Pseudobutyrivibrio sp. YE44]SDB29296.1 hypothetical protein SAMN02910298_01430 [Pseudobutyrivibrio sp. YE44]